MTPQEPGKIEGTTPKMDKPIKYCFVTQYEQTDNPKMFEKHNNEKIAITISIVEAWLVAYHFC